MHSVEILHKDIEHNIDLDRNLENSLEIESTQKKTSLAKARTMKNSVVGLLNDTDARDIRKDSCKLSAHSIDDRVDKLTNRIDQEEVDKRKVELKIIII